LFGFRLDAVLLIYYPPPTSNTRFCVLVYLFRKNEKSTNRTKKKRKEKATATENREKVAIAWQVSWNRTNAKGATLDQPDHYA
jgi:hypothetical protein